MNFTDKYLRFSCYVVIEEDDNDIIIRIVGHCDCGFKATKKCIKDGRYMNYIGLDENNVKWEFCFKYDCE